MLPLIGIKILISMSLVCKSFLAVNRFYFYYFPTDAFCLLMKNVISSFITVYISLIRGWVFDKSNAHCTDKDFLSDRVHVAGSQSTEHYLYLWMREKSTKGQHKHEWFKVARTPSLWLLHVSETFLSKSRFCRLHLMGGRSVSTPCYTE